jgi:hypothetical protein
MQRRQHKMVLFMIGNRHVFGYGTSLPSFYKRQTPRRQSFPCFVLFGCWYDYDCYYHATTTTTMTTTSSCPAPRYR